MNGSTTLGRRATVRPGGFSPPGLSVSSRHTDRDLSLHLFSWTKLLGLKREKSASGNRFCLGGGGWGGGWVEGKEVVGGIWCKQCIHMYINTKMIPVETVPGIRGGGMRKRSVWGGWNSSMIFLIHCKSLYKCYNVKKSHPQGTDCKCSKILPPLPSGADTLSSD
jgi:hypothetical protein